MAKKLEANNDKPAAELMKFGEQNALEQLPEWMDAKDTAGSEDIDASEIRLPRLAIAQGTSKEMSPEESSYLPNLKLYDLFNDSTGEIYGRGPVPLIVVRRDTRRIEFRPRSEGGGVIDLDVPPGDPRCEWTEGEDGKKSVPPRATLYEEFAAILIHTDDRDPEPIVLSIKTTNKYNRKAAEDLKRFIKLAPPIYKAYRGVYSKPEKSDKANAVYGTYVVKNGGPVRVQAHYELAKAFRESLTGKTIVINRDDTSEVDDSMAANPEDSGAPKM